MDEPASPSVAASTSAPTCPYCQASLPKRPQRKSKCPACGQPIFVKTHPTSGERVLLTEEQAQAIEAEWAVIYQARATEGLVLKYHLSVDVFRERRARTGAPSDNDIIWGMFNEDLQSLTTRGDLYGLKCRYYDMALFAGAEGRSFAEPLEACHRMDLLLMQKTGRINRVEIMTSGPGNACAACEKLSGRTLSLDEALRTMPLPCKACTMVVVGTRPGFCRCVYTPLVS